MKAWLAAAVFGIVTVLATATVLLDHLRSSVRVTPGLGDAAVEPVEGVELVAPAEREAPSTRSAVATTAQKPSALEVHVAREDGKPIAFAEVLARREDELVRAGRTDGSGIARLIPFAGPGSVRVERSSRELARVDVKEGRGRLEIVVPDRASVSGIVLVDGTPRAEVELVLQDGPVEGMMDARLRPRLESWGWVERRPSSWTRTDSDGRFRFDLLPEDWSGVLRLDDPEHHRFADGGTQVALGRPQQDLTLELRQHRAEPVIRGRVTFGGQPVPRARWRYHLRSDSGGTAGPGVCDEHGRFSIRAPADFDQLAGLALEFFAPGVGAVIVRRSGPLTDGDLGDVELRPTRDVPFVVTTVSGEPLAGARALPLISGSDSVEPRMDMLERSLGLLVSEPTDEEGRGVLRSLRTEADRIIVGAPGHAQVEVVVPPGPAAAPLTVALARSSSVAVALRGPAGRIPRGVCVRLRSSGGPFTWKDGVRPGAGEEGLFPPPDVAHWSRADGHFLADYVPEDEGRVWITDLRPGARFDLAAVDAYGSVLAEARELALEPREWRSIELRAPEEPRSLLVIVRDALDTPIAGAYLWIAPAGSTSRGSTSRSTDRAGMTRIESLYSTDVKVRVDRRGYVSREVEHLRVPREGATVEIRLARDWWPW